ncbi:MULTISPECIES: helix-turn-helix transcriptional regulator [Pseudoalteromonas]|uniref:helix-turn-helix transcriptional regulator n=1 Tax=Pseudoalteromonas TaxID=53246 RepID=UPI000C4BE164|nr:MULTISPECIES: helix-turn-helix transcriptional regulator [Pseudoalteromonas]MAY60217.1 transcriptional regulator [Pseudoalteromonas sp.]MDN3409808.1 helix-turn-helix transcriptional regulator [Pseudoalteromonas sp. APC 3894]MDN3417094.1 helix-turn-helix transcriptional regulator [Pseudoalteromonas sp. APC 3227]MDN3420695.1 helix-turn-helix transcriptional regulator [Pseudoalteromonas sp. APC 3895]MDN3424592.1 helix-turn-helix transcriptional regulator [Pseudoalteromonas sp. APC 3896]
MQNNIAKFRKEAGLSQQELADAINVSRKTISTVETNRFTPSVIIALKIARHFNTSVESLFEIEDHD